MIKIKGTLPLVENLLKLKGVPYTIEDGRGVIETKDFELSNLDAIVHYLDERFPIPQLISGDVENRARIREITTHVQKDLKVCDILAKNASPFVFGQNITLVDLVVYEKTTEAKFKAFINKILNETTIEEW